MLRSHPNFSVAQAEQAVCASDQTDVVCSLSLIPASDVEVGHLACGEQTGEFGLDLVGAGLDVAASASVKKQGRLVPVPTIKCNMVSVIWTIQGH